MFKSSLFKSKIIKSRAGQVLVEYLLLMVIAIGCSAILTKKLVSRDTSNGGTGLIVDAWNRLLTAIGHDVPDCDKPQCR